MRLPDVRRGALGAIAGALLSLPFANAAAAFGLSFDWGDTAACTERRSPFFRLFGVPRGTVRLVFNMVNLDQPDVIHGGGTVSYGGEVQISRGRFGYRGPCPPRGQRQRYRWSVTAEDGGGQSLGTATAMSYFPLDPEGRGLWGPMPLLPPRTQ